MSIETASGPVTGSAGALVLHPMDDVAVARVQIERGQALTLAGRATVVALDTIPAGHKISLRAITKGDAIRKFGQIIGVAVAPIEEGRHVHSHNLDLGSSDLTHAIGQAYAHTAIVYEPATFEGYRRPDGRVGTRNYVGVISSVNCSATVVKAIANAFGRDVLDRHPNVDGVVAITHGGGCGMSGSGEGIDLLRRTLRGYAESPNFAAVLVVGLGCEVNQVAALVEPLQAREAGRVATLTIQQAGGTREAIAQGQQIVREMVERASLHKRTTVSARHLTVGLQCGGSDGYSGISANPALGAAVDLLVRHGGTAILSETPEIYGAEHLLTARAASAVVGQRLLDRLTWWEDYTAKNGSRMDNNPSPGNKAGGITTILEKSLGAVAKGGGTGLMAVLDYAETVNTSGLVFMDTPGYDPVSATGQVAGGANLICFTTGRGSTYGCKPTPALKLATNTPMFDRMRMDMDFNAGEIIDGTSTVQEAGERIFRLMLATASGQKTLSETHGLGDNEFVPWQLGAVL